jgi:hypothetical protein
MKRVKTPHPVHAAERARVASRPGVAAAQAKADQYAASLAGTIAEIRAAGFTSCADIARELNHRGGRTPRGLVWSGSQVRRLLRRLDAAPALQVPA